MSRVEVTQETTPLSDGILKTDLPLDGTLQVVKDQLNNSSTLQLSNTTATVNSTLTVAEKLNIESDSTVTTQTSSVIQATTTNANLVLAPNGTGAIVASIPDGTATGGNARGNNAVDLQTARAVASNAAVASGLQSSILGGYNNRASNNYSVVTGGYNNTSSGDSSVVLGGYSNSSSGANSVAAGIFAQSTGTASVVSGGNSNNASSNYSTVSGGQSNTASTNTHATVVGGQSNTASGQHAISGGNSNIASGSTSISLGGQSNTASAIRSVSLGGFSNTSSLDYAVTVGGLACQATNAYAVALGNRTRGYLLGQFSYSGGNFTTSGGECQQSILTSYKEATLLTSAITVLSLDGTGTTNLIIPSGNNRLWNVVASWSAIVTAITGTATGVSVGDVATECNLLAFKRVGGTSSVVGTVTNVASHSDLSMASASMSYTAGASQEMALTFTGPTFLGGGSVTCRVVCKLMLTEVAY